MQARHKVQSAPKPNATTCSRPAPESRGVCLQLRPIHFESRGCLGLVQLFGITMTYFGVESASSQDRQTAGSRSLTEYVTVIPNVRTELGLSPLIRLLQPCSRNLEGARSLGAAPTDKSFIWSGQGWFDCWRSLFVPRLRGTAALQVNCGFEALF